MSWPPGTIVVCVDAHTIFNHTIPDPVPLVEGAYYTIKDSWQGYKGPYVRVVEFPYPNMSEAGHMAIRFRRAESDHSEVGSVRQQEPTSV